MRAGCGQIAGRLRAGCGQVEGRLRAGCGQVAGGSRAGCADLMWLMVPAPLLHTRACLAQRRGLPAPAASHTEHWQTCTCAHDSSVGSGQALPRMISRLHRVRAVVEIGKWHVIRARRPVTSRKWLHEVGGVLTGKYEVGTWMHSQGLKCLGNAGTSASPTRASTGVDHAPPQRSPLCGSPARH